MGKESATYDILLGKNTLSKGYEDVDKAASKAESSINRINNGGSGGGNGSGMFKSIIGGNLMASAISKATGALADFGKESITAFAKYEQFGVALTTMFHGNKAEAKGLQDELVNFAKTTPFELTEIQDATKQLIAYGSTSQGVGKELRMLGDISSGVGAPIGEIAYLYGTARTQGRLFARDIYQLSGRGIPIVHELAKQFKTTDDQVMKLVEHGKVGFPEMQRALASMTGEGGQFFNMMNEQSKTLAGRWSNLMDAVGQLQVKLSENKAGLMGSLVDWSQKFVNNLVDAQQIVNDLQRSEGVSKTGDKNWFQRNFEFGRQTQANKENLQAFNSTTEEFALKALKEGNGKLFEKYANEIKDQADRDAKFLGVGVYKGMMHTSRGGGLDKRGFNEQEVMAELGMLGLISSNLKSQANLLAAGKRLPKNKVTGEASTVGSGVTIEAGTPKNININIANFQPNWKVESVDTSIPISDIKEKTGRAMIELLNDAAMMEGQQHG